MNRVPKLKIYVQGQAIRLTVSQLQVLRQINAERTPQVYPNYDGRSLKALVRLKLVEIVPADAPTGFGKAAMTARGMIAIEQARSAP